MENQEAQGKRDESLIQLVTFSIGEEVFGVDILAVQEIIRLMDITRVPRSPDFVEGVINLRGKVIPIVDLRKRFGLVERAYDTSTRIIVINMDSITVGFVVDEVAEVLRLPSNMIDTPPGVVSGLDSDYIDGVGRVNEMLLILLDLNRLLSNQEVEALAKV